MEAFDLDISRDEYWRLYYVDNRDHPLLIIHQYFGPDGQVYEFWLDRNRDGVVDHYEMNVWPSKAFYEKYPDVCSGVS